MDMALLKKMNVYPADANLVGFIPETGTGESTLIKADVSLFHDAPLIDGSVEDEEAKLSEYETGFKEGEAKAHIVFNETVKVMQMALDKVQAEMASMTRQIEQSHLSALVDCLRAVFPSLMRGGTDLELQTLLQDACSEGLKGRIQLHVSPDDQAHCERLCREQDILITADKSLTPLQMRLQWIGGGADINCQAVAELCLKHLDAASLQVRE